MTDGFDIALAREIDRAGDDPSRLLPLRERLVAEHARIDAALLEADRWIGEGCFVEAVAYSEDAGNLVRRGRAVDDALARISLETEGVPEALDRRRLERLDVAYADVASIEALLVDHQRLALSNASVDDRIDALDRIRQRHRAHRGWTHDSDALERVALEESMRDAERAAATEDSEALDALHRRLSRRHWGRDVPVDLAKTIDGTRERLRRRLVSEQAKSLADRLHQAFAAMDAAEVAAIEPQWRRLASPDGTAGGAIDPSLVESADSAFRWLASSREAEVLDRRAAEAIVEIERLLDASAPVAELRACRDRIFAAGGSPPPHLARRVEAVEERTARAVRRRRNRRLAGVASVIALAIGGASYVAWRVEVDRRALESIEEVDRRVRRGEFDRASAMLSELERADVVEGFWNDDAKQRWIEMEGSARTAIADAQARALRLESALGELSAGLDSDREGDPDRPDRLLELRSLEAIANAAGDRDEPRLVATRAEIDSRIGAVLQARAADQRARLLAAEADLSPIPITGPGGTVAEAAEEQRRLEALGGRVDSLAAESETDRRESEAARSLRDRIDRRIAAAARREEALATFEQRRRELVRSMDEAAFLDRYRTLVEEHGDVLAAQGSLIAFERGLADARLADAVAHWRRTSSRSILAASSIDDPWHPTDRASARTIGAILGEHLSRHPQSPHAAAAGRLSSYVEEIARVPTSGGEPDDLAGIVSAQLRSTGFDELLRVRLANGGFVYRKAGGSGVFDNALAHSGELILPAGRLLPRTDTTSPAAGAPEPTMPAQLLQQWLPRIENASGSRVRAELLGLIAAAASAEESDPMLQLAFLEALHRVAAETPLIGTAMDATPERSWLDELARRSPPSNPVDWAADAPRGREELGPARRRARLALATMPDAERERERGAAMWSSLLEELSPRSVIGVVEPIAGTESWRFLPVGAGGGSRAVSGRVVMEGLDGAATFVPIDIDGGDAVFLGPQPTPAPRLVFDR